MISQLLCVPFLQIQIVAKTAGMHRDEWVEKSDRLVAGFLEMFEERCHKMVKLSFPLISLYEKSPSICVLCLVSVDDFSTGLCKRTC